MRVGRRESFEAVVAARLVEDGMSYAQAAREAGVSYLSAKLAALKRGIHAVEPPPRPRQPRSPPKVFNRERDASIKALFKAGESMESIGSRFKVSRERVRQILRKADLTGKDGGFSLAMRRQREREAEGAEAVSMQRWGVDVATRKQYRKNGVLRAYESQRNNAMARGIEWGLTFAQWLQVWLDSGMLEQRGRKKGQYVMSRRHDEGAYRIGNVFIQLATENTSQSRAKLRGKRAANTGVWCIYPGRPRAWRVKVGDVSLGLFASEEEAVAARNEYIAANPSSAEASRGTLGAGRGYTIITKGKTVRYQVMVGPKYIGQFKSAEEAIRARARAIDAVLSQSNKNEGAE